MNSELLLKLADHMEGVDDKNYAQSAWVNAEYHGPEKIKKGRIVARSWDGTAYRQVTFPEGFCNSTACVFGHAALMPGSKLKVAKKDDLGYAIFLPRPHKKPLRGFEAAAAYFDIPELDAQIIFGFPSGKTSQFYIGHGGFNTKSVAKALRAYVADPINERRRAEGLRPI